MRAPADVVKKVACNFCYISDEGGLQKGRLMLLDCHSRLSQKLSGKFVEL